MPVTHNDIRAEGKAHAINPCYLLTMQFLDVFVYDAYSDTPHIHLVNYSNALPITYMPNSHVVLPMAPPGGTVGYDSPESVVYPEADLAQRDEWAVGMTVYVYFKGTPLYGYVTGNGQVHRISNREYINTLKVAYETGKGQLNFAPIDNAAMAYFADLRPLAIRLLAIDPIYRTRLPYLLDGATHTTTIITSQ